MFEIVARSRISNLNSTLAVCKRQTINTQEKRREAIDSLPDADDDADDDDDDDDDDDAFFRRIRSWC